MTDFVRKLRKAPEAFSFDDFSLVPAETEVLPHEVDIQSRFSRTITLKVPVVSSPMDRVTEHRLAIAIAAGGGIGIIHKIRDIARQVEEVGKVKRHQSGMITEPYTLDPNDSVKNARALMKSENISGIPIVMNGRLVGILTQRDVQFGDKDDQRIDDAMTKKVITAPVGTDWKRALEILATRHIEKLPIVDGDRLIGLITLRDIKKHLEFPNATQDADGRLRVGAAVGATGDFLERAQALIAAGVDALVVDSSHGHSKNVGNAVRALKKLSGAFDIVAGNIVTSEAAQFLIGAGADGLRVGIGSGSICTTRIVTGCGRAQMSAIAAVASSKGDIPVIADGGIRWSGDTVKAFAAGADSVMIGNLFAGTDESPSKTITVEGQMFKEYRGMGSEEVLREGGDRYVAKAVAEGITGRVQYRGPLSNELYQLEGGLRQGMGYVGCRTIAELQEKTVLDRITLAGLRESHPHDVDITSEPGNYRIFDRK